MLAIKYPCRTFKFFAFFTTDFCNTSFFGKIAIQNLQWPVAFIGCFDGINNFLCFKIQIRHIC